VREIQTPRFSSTWLVVMQVWEGALGWEGSAEMVAPVVRESSLVLKVPWGVEVRAESLVSRVSQVDQGPLVSIRFLQSSLNVF
jgi:hypothetical protein